MLAARGVTDTAQRLAAAQRAQRADAEPEHYAVLGLAHGASVADVRSAFRCASLLTVPSKPGTFISHGPECCPLGSPLFCMLQPPG